MCIDDLIAETVTDVRKSVRWNSPFYGLDGDGWFLSCHCFTDCVKVFWLNGAGLDPRPPLASKHDRVRYLNIERVEEIDDEQLRDWIGQAAALPGDEMF